MRDRWKTRRVSTSTNHTGYIKVKSTQVRSHTKSQSEFLHYVLYSARLKDVWALERTAVQSPNLGIHSWTISQNTFHCCKRKPSASFCFLVTLKTSSHNDPDKSKLTLLQVIRVAAAGLKPLGNVIGINSCGNSSCKIQFNHSWWRTFSLCAFSHDFSKRPKKLIYPS